MKALSQSEYGLIKSLYQDVYSPDIAESILDEFTDEDLDDLTDEYIEEQVTEFFEECLEEGLDIDIVEQTICESVDTELEVLTEKVDPNEIQRRRDQSKDRLATGKAMKSAASKPKESSGGDRDAGAMARAKLKVSKQKVGSASPEKKASALSRIKGAVKKVGKAAQGGVGLAARAVGTAQRAGSAVKSAAKSGYERGKQGSGGGSSSSSSSDSAPTSSASGPSSSSSSDGGSSSSSSSGGGSSSPAPTKRKDGLLKRGLKKVVRGISKGVSAAAGAVKAGADSLTDRARKEDMNYNKELATIKELYRQVCNHQEEEPEQLDEADSLAAMQARGEKVLANQRKRKSKADVKDSGNDYIDRLRFKEEVEEYIDFIITEGYDCSDLTWNDMYEEYQSLDEGLRSAVKRLLGGKKKEEPAKPMSRGDELRKKYNVGPERSDTSAKAQILKKTRAKAESDQKEFGGSRYSKGVADRSKAAHERQLKGGYSKYGADDARGSGNKARKRAAALTKEELEQIDEMGKSDDGVRSRMKISGYEPPTNWDPEANRGKGATVSPKQAEKRRRKSLRQEELEATGLFTVKEIEALVESENVDEAITSEKGKAALKKEEVEKLDEISQKTATKAFAKRATDEFENDGDYRGDFTKSGKSKANETKRRIEKKHGKKAGQHAERAAHATTFGRKSFSMPKVDEEYVDEAMSSYDRNRKRAAQRAADRNAARAAGKTGVVPGVGYVTPRREKETYTDEKGTVRHKSGAKNEELELDENRRAARAAGGYKDDSKKQTDPSKAGFTGISNSIADIMRQNKEIEARKKK